MSDLLSIGASGVRAYQAALTTVSENIANAGNAIYSRRATGINELAPVGGGIAASRVQAGMGVAIGATTRSADAYRAAAVRSAGADLARTEAGSVWLDRIQTALTGNDLGARITSFFNAARTVAADPSSSTPRAVMLENAIALAAGFTTTGNALAQAAVDLDATATDAVATLDALGTALAKINDSLGRANPGTASAAGLADQRDAILEQMSALVDVGATFDAAGRATVRIGGSAGPVFVAGSVSGQMTYARNAEGAVAFAITRDAEIASVSPNGGVLAGVADGAQRIAEARRTLDGIATRFVTGINDLQAEGRDLNGAAGAAMFSVGATPTEISLSLSDPAGIAAAAIGEGVRGNGNLARLEALRADAGFETKLTTLVATNAASIESRTTIAEAQSAIRAGAVASRDAVTGVDLDSEAVDLLRFQQAYQASSRVIQIARETFQTIIGIN